MAEAIDAGLAKTRWIANKPGMAFSNQSFLQPGSSNGFLYDRHHDGLVPMHYLDQAKIQVVEKTCHGETSRANVTMSLRAPLRKRVALLRTF